MDNVLSLIDSLGGDCMYHPEPIRSLREVIDIYMRYRSTCTDKSKFDRFEGQRFFRFGNSWRRLSHDKRQVVVLNDNSEDLSID